MTSVFRQLLGDALDRVPDRVRALHDARLPCRFEGRAVVRPAQGWLARRVARSTGLPLDHGELPIAVRIEAAGDGQVWIREFGRPMRSRLWREGGVLVEDFGWVRFRFRIDADAEGIRWVPLSVRVLGVPVPWGRALLRGVFARESVQDGRYAFDVGARLPLLGHLVHYAGWLDVG